MKAKISSYNLNINAAQYHVLEAREVVNVTVNGYTDNEIDNKLDEKLDKPSNDDWAAMEIILFF
jgi:hypothetical protein